ncbi:MAG: 16S rRNA (guanine(966)-N(2))-methyltransferase RsmD [Pseudomonadota bacterium]
MRIVGGQFRGRRLAAPAANDQRTRPTTDRTRETLFNILEHRFGDKVGGARVIDLFAGTGALGCEAISRGASFCLFVEPAGHARALIRKSIETLQLQGVTQLFRRDATRMGPIGTMKPFDVAFADPPYGKGLGDRTLVSLAEGGWLSDSSIVVLEEHAASDVALPDHYVLREQRSLGETKLRFLEYSLP